MKISEFIMAKALEYDDFSLTKIAQELYETENDKEYMDKEGAIGSVLLSAGKALLGNNTVRNAVIGMGTGAVSGAVNAGEGNRLSGALKGAAIGGAVGGLATGGMNVAKTMKANPGSTFMQAAKQEVGAVGSSLKTFGSTVKPLMKTPPPINPAGQGM